MQYGINIKTKYWKPKVSFCHVHTLIPPVLYKKKCLSASDYGDD